jgi:hypothetical protein
MSPRLLPIFQQAYRELRPRAPMPEFEARFYPFSNINNTIRVRQGRVLARVSDLLEGAPDDVLHAIAHILVAKLYRKPIDSRLNKRYRNHVTGKAVRNKAELIRQVRGRKQIDTARGHIYDLEQIFDELNTRFFHGLLGRPRMTWSRGHARNALGHFDPAHNAIVVSRVFDQPRVPRYAIEYIVYHEMLHLQHPVRVRSGRRCVHPPQFQAEEKLFPEWEAAKSFMKRL